MIAARLGGEAAPSYRSRIRASRIANSIIQPHVRVMPFVAFGASCNSASRWRSLPALSFIACPPFGLVVCESRGGGRVWLRRQAMDARVVRRPGWRASGMPAPARSLRYRRVVGGGERGALPERPPEQPDDQEAGDDPCRPGDLLALARAHDAPHLVHAAGTIHRDSSAGSSGSGMSNRSAIAASTR